MRRVLYILGQLDDLDVEWLAKVAAKRQLRAGDTLVREGVASRSMFIILDGHAEVGVQGIGVLATLGVGDMVGELSFVDSAPPSATVTCQTPCVVLDIAKADITERLGRDQGFGMRFYRAIALFLADRLRGTVRRMGLGGDGEAMNADQILEDELDENILNSVTLAGERFDRLVRTLASARTV
ncbi:MAG: cyclic nucleotide-binding domain-containing protein [Alphaproteobacteria bacterium]|nr:cyclic nucleotide-binding domain-containing protein [Alphaproteobacteria bacterium]